MADPTDRQRAEAKVGDIVELKSDAARRLGSLFAKVMIAYPDGDIYCRFHPDKANYFVAAHEWTPINTRSEGWEAGREAAAKLADDMSAEAGEEGYRWLAKAVAAIRALPTPEDRT